MNTETKPKDCTINEAICVIAVAVETRDSMGKPFNNLEIVAMIEDFCRTIPSDRWTAISSGVVDRLEYWGVIEKV
jgi:hypothetical protein